MYTSWSESCSGAGREPNGPRADARGASSCPSHDIDALWFGCHALQRNIEFGTRFSIAPRGRLRGKSPRAPLWKVTSALTWIRSDAGSYPFANPDSAPHSEGGIIRLETLIELKFRVFRAYPLIEIRQSTVPCRAIRGNIISLNSTLSPSYVCVSSVVIWLKSSVLWMRCCMNHETRRAAAL